MNLTSNEAKHILSLLANVHGPGYAEEQAVGQLQAKLSIMSEAAIEAGPEIKNPLEGFRYDGAILFAGMVAGILSKDPSEVQLREELEHAQAIALNI